MPTPTGSSYLDERPSCEHGAMKPGLADVRHGLSGLERQWLREAIRLREEHTGPLEDSEANRYARLAGGDLAQRIEYRALWLAERDGLKTALQHWRQGARLALLVMLVLALLAGMGLAYAALGDGQRTVNIFQALGSLLGLNLLMLAAWLLGFLLSGDSASALGRFWLWLSEKLARDARAVQLAPALLLLLQRQRLERWGLGILAHGLWLLILTTALVVLIALLATRQYAFIWETTLLDSDSFVALTQAIGALPAMFGFALPALDLIRASGGDAMQAEAARQAWSIWLLGALFVYGILPRLLLLLFCWWRWWRGQTRLLGAALDEAAYAALRERLLPSSERLPVDELAPAISEPYAATAAGNEIAGSGAVLAAIELDETQPWPPPSMPAAIHDAGIIDSREQRERLLDQLSLRPPERLLLACDPRRSPDRGTLALLAELARTAVASRVWLLAPPAGDELDPDRLDSWQQLLRAQGLTYGGAELLDWLQTGDCDASR